MVLALLIKSDYPELWADAFEQLRSLLVVGAGGAGGVGAAGVSAAAARARVELYLRVLCALDEEVVSFHVDRSREEADHNSLIKVRRACVRDGSGWVSLRVSERACVCVCVRETGEGAGEKRREGRGGMEAEGQRQRQVDIVWCRLVAGEREDGRDAAQRGCKHSKREEETEVEKLEKLVSSFSRAGHQFRARFFLSSSMGCVVAHRVFWTT